MNNFIRKTKTLLNRLGNHGLDPDSESVGPKTISALDTELAKRETAGPVPGEVSSRPVNPAYEKAKEYKGKGESNSAFVVWLSGFWRKVGLPQFKTIVGASFAWCGLFLATMNSETGQKWVNGAAGARNWATYGQQIDWRKDGIPQGAVVTLDHSKLNCKKGTINHVAFADGDCTAADLLKVGSTIAIYGGNQSNTVKTSIFSTKEICSVGWPNEQAKPAAVAVSKNCSTGSASKDSTR